MFDLIIISTIRNINSGNIYEFYVHIITNLFNIISPQCKHIKCVSIRLSSYGNIKV